MGEELNILPGFTRFPIHSTGFYEHSMGCKSELANFIHFILSIDNTALDIIGGNWSSVMLVY